MAPLFADDSWPLVLFGLRLAAVALLYLFLFSAFRALRGELRTARSATVEAPERGPAREAARPRSRARIEALPPPLPPARYPDEYEDDFDEPEDRDYLDEYEPATSLDDDYVSERAPAPRTLVRRIPARVAIPAVAALLVVVLGTGALFVRGDTPGQPEPTPAASEGTPPPFGPPAVAPAAGRVTVGLAATEDAQLRVTVDGTVEFEGTLRAGQRQAWEGGQRIQVWTDSGRTLLLAVNGQDLGPYSPAMGHPDWNRIDFGFWPGWSQ